MLVERSKAAPRRSSPGSLAMVAAMRRASSRVSRNLRYSPIEPPSSAEHYVLAGSARSPAAAVSSQATNSAFLGGGVGLRGVKWGGGGGAGVGGEPTGRGESRYMRRRRWSQEIPMGGTLSGTWGGEEHKMWGRFMDHGGGHNGGVWGSGAGAASSNGAEGGSGGLGAGRA